MNSKGLSWNFLLLMLACSFLEQGQCRKDEDPSHSYKSCLDHMGKTVFHAMKFTPPNDDVCKWCYCDDGQAEACQSVWCEPPRCQYFTIGPLCCDFKCLDNEPFFKLLNFFTFPVILIAFLSFLIFVVIWCVLQYRKAKARRRQWEETAKLPSIVVSENLYLEMSVDIMEKSDEISELKKKICLLEHQLGHVESSMIAQDDD